MRHRPGEGRICIRRPVEGVPREIHILPYGRVETVKGPFEVDDEGMALIIADFLSLRNDMVIDYEHQSLSGGEAPAAGWIKRLFPVFPGGSRGDGNPPRSAGLWAVVEWTPRAVDYLRNREYRYLSPVFLKTVSDGRVVKLINAALTNQPAIDGMEPVVNKDNDPHLTPVLRGGEGELEKRKEVSMEKLMELLGLKADATEEQALERVRAIKARVSELEARPVHEEVASALGLEQGADPVEAARAVMALRQGHDRAAGLAEKVAALEAELIRKEACGLVAQAMGQGKVTAAQRAWAEDYAVRDPEGFRAFVAGSPVIIHTGEVADGGIYSPGTLVDGVQMAVNRAMGISDETFRKYNS